MSRTRWIASFGALALLLSGGLVIAPTSAASETIHVWVQDGRLAEVDEPTGYIVIGVGIPRGTPLTIVWGDGTAQIARSKCSKKRARSRPYKCRIRVGHQYSEPGPYEVNVLSGEEIVASGTITVLKQETGEPTYSAPTIEDSGIWRSIMLARVNEVRAANGVGPVNACPRLDEVSQNYAQLMADTGHYDHTGPNGESPWERMAAGGYIWRAAGENIAYGYPTTQEVQQGWEESPGHFENMVNGRVRDAGFGAAESSSGRWYYVQMYGAGGNCDLGGQTVVTPAPVSTSS